MVSTTHGWYIPGTQELKTTESGSRIRCGGPSLCPECATESIHALNADLDPGLEDLIPAIFKERGIVSNEIQMVELVRKPFFVTAVQVTEGNMAAVAKWCGGDVRLSSRSRAKKSVKVVHVEVLRATADWHREARVGDWVVKAGSGYKIYTDKALKDSFDSVAVEGARNDPILEIQEDDNYGAALAEIDRQLNVVDCD